jgi:putative membrane protein
MNVGDIRLVHTATAEEDMQQMFEQCMAMMGSMMGSGMMSGGMMGSGMMGTMLWLVVGGTLFLIALVVAGAVLLLRALSHRMNTTQQQPLRLLQERFARGELDAEEYQQRLDVLQGRGS